MRVARRLVGTFEVPTVCGRWEIIDIQGENIRILLCRARVISTIFTGFAANGGYVREPIT